jgi:hypothetical protein
LAAVVLAAEVAVAVAGSYSRGGGGAAAWRRAKVGQAEPADMAAAEVLSYFAIIVVLPKSAEPHSLKEMEVQVVQVDPAELVVMAESVELV